MIKKDEIFMYAVLLYIFEFNILIYRISKQIKMENKLEFNFESHIVCHRI